MKTFSTFFLCLVAFSSWLRASDSYTMSDLEALEAQKSYREFLDHALDIRPSERGAQWVEMVSDMASGLIDFKMKRLQVDRQGWQEIEKLSLWPSLQNDEFFQTKRANYLRRYLPDCLKKAASSEATRPALKSCEKELTLYWGHSPKDIDLGIELAQIIRDYSLSLSTWPFLARAPLSPLASLFCQRPIVQDGLMNELTKPLSQRMDLKQIRDHMKTLMRDECWQQLAPLVQKELAQTSASQIKREALYRLLKARDELSLASEDLFLVTYLLQGPVVGDTFNLAWSRLKELGENYSRRQKLFESLASADMLPDSLFASANHESREVIMNHFDQFFPEYFPHYAKTCLNYRHGRGPFPLGNPTLHCPDFFKISEKKKWIEQDLKIQYSGRQKP